MARSKTMERSRVKELRDLRKLTPPERLMLAVKLSDFCLKLKKAGTEAQRRVPRKKS
ncbi:MAG: hypothetical protein HY890_05755 [Deltaproteobacteria bacterium]|nr:hypothetical protein [Deltaproteobacteria bacterium]